MKPLHYPFAAIVEQESMKTAMILNAVDPQDARPNRSPPPESRPERQLKFERRDILRFSLMMVVFQS